MKVKNRILTLLILSSASAAAIAAINEVLKITATSRNLLADDNSLCYKWRLGNIHYTKTGSGKPLLLIHDLTAASSGYEWSHVIAGLQEEYTVYTIDLLGCGRSEKVNLTYTNYLYEIVYKKCNWTPHLSGCFRGILLYSHYGLCP